MNEPIQMLTFLISRYLDSRSEVRHATGEGCHLGGMCFTVSVGFLACIGPEAQVDTTWGNKDTHFEGMEEWKN